MLELGHIFERNQVCVERFQTLRDSAVTELKPAAAASFELYKFHPMRTATRDNCKTFFNQMVINGQTL